MDKRLRRSPSVQAYLKALGNPYASLQLDDEVQPSKVSEMSAENRDLYRKSENPQAFHYYESSPESDRGATEPTPAAEVTTTRCSMSKAEFRSQCRAIFRPYIPALEKGRLRAHHRDFVTRNESQSAEVRYALVQQLRRYDLSAVPGLTSQFNRERNALTEAKLIEIERAVGVKR